MRFSIIYRRVRLPEDRGEPVLLREAKEEFHFKGTYPVGKALARAQELLGQDAERLAFERIQERKIRIVVDIDVTDD
jgi:hypothetical protein